MTWIAAALDLSAASQLIALAPLSVISALLAGRCGPRINLLLDVASLLLSAAMAAVLFDAINSAPAGEPTGLSRYAYYFAAGPLLLALWATDGLLHRLALSNQARSDSAAINSITGQGEAASEPIVDPAYSQLSSG